MAAESPVETLHAAPADEQPDAHHLDELVPDPGADEIQAETHVETAEDGIPDRFDGELPPDSEPSASEDEAAGDDATHAEGEAAFAAEAAPEAVSDAPIVNHSIETVGGDEIEETARPRARPHRHYKIQEVIKRRQIMLVQVTKEERGNKGAALTTYISLAGRYCVLMPNTPRGGGVSRKITSMQDRRRLKDLMSDLEVPEGMGVIVRTAGSERSKVEIKRDFEYLLRLWDEIRELTLKSTAPALIYEEGNLIKRSIRDLYARDIDEVLVDGREGYDTARSFMQMLMPTHTKRVKFYNDPTVPLLHRFQVEGQLDAIHSPVVQLRSGGYIVINPTEALVAIDVNSGRSTRERNIEETAVKTNCEAAEEVARQLRLRDLAGLIVIDFIDMEEHRNNGAVERRLKDAMRHDRARIQLGRISPFGLLELSRQRLRPSLLEASTQPCPHCNGTGNIRSTESTALHVLRAIEEEGMRRRTAEVSVAVPRVVALYILNQKRAALTHTESRYHFHVLITEDDTLVPPAFRLDRLRAFTPVEIAALPAPQVVPPPVEEPDDGTVPDDEMLDADGHVSESEGAEPHEHDSETVDTWRAPSGEEQPERTWEGREEGGSEEGGAGQVRRRRRRRRRGGGDRNREPGSPAPSPAAEYGSTPIEAEEGFGAGGDEEPEIEGAPGEAQPVNGQPGVALGPDGEHRRRRRGRRGGRRRRRGAEGEHAPHHADGTPGEPWPEHQPDTALSLATGHDEGHDDAGHNVVTAAAPAQPEPAHYQAELSIEVKPVARAHEEAPVSAPTPAPIAAPAESEPAERTPIAYNVPPPVEVTSPPANPRRGWWRR
jgi:ribonuclease E